MDGFGANVVEDHLGAAAYYPTLDWIRASEALDAGLVARRMDELETLVVTKTAAGFDTDCVKALRGIVRDAAAGRLGRLKFIAFEFTHKGNGPSAGAEGFAALISDVANLILAAPIITVACARAHMEGADLEFALACSMLVGEENARFSFAGDPIISLATYGFLAQKIGFVRAERLMERGDVLDAEQMQAMLLLKDITETGPGFSGMERFLRRAGRRHNSSYGIYRAQRIAAPAVDESLRSA